MEWGPYQYGGYYSGGWPTQPVTPAAMDAANVQQNFAPVTVVQSLTPPPSKDSDCGLQHGVLPSVTVKIINPDRKSDYKNYVIRDVSTKYMLSLNGMKSMLKEELGDLVPAGFQFDIGFYKGNKQVWLRTESDVKEVVCLLKEKPDCVLWCMGPGENAKEQKRKRKDSSDEDGNERKKDKKKKTRQEEKEERVDAIVDDLRKQHATKFTNLQYRIWAETIVSGTHESCDDPPRGSFFSPKGQSVKKAHASPGPSPGGRNSPGPSIPQPSSSTVMTPGKCAQLRSTYIKQIKELHDLLEVGAIAAEHFEKQRDTLLAQMDRLN